MWCCLETERADERDKQSDALEPQGFFRRLAKLTTGAAKTYAGNLAGASGNAVQGEALRQREEKSGEIKAWQDTIDAYHDVLRDPMATDSERKTATDMISDLERRISAYQTAYGAGGVSEKAAGKINAATDKLTDSGAADIERCRCWTLASRCRSTGALRSWASPAAERR